MDNTCTLCTRKIKLCGTDTILTWLFTDLGADYSIGSFIEQVGGLTDEGFETDCFEIVDNTTEVTDSTIHVGSFYDHSNIGSCEDCSESVFDPCDCSVCGEGYVDIGNGQCKLSTYSPVIPPDNPYVVVPEQWGLYSELGTRLYSSFNSDGSGTSTLLDTLGVWKITEADPDTAGVGSGDGPLNRSGIWVLDDDGTPFDPVSEFYYPQDTWIGFTRCIDVDINKSYFVGLGADNDFRLKINNNTIIDTKSSDYWNNSLQSFVFKQWHLYEITSLLIEGNNVIEVCGNNRSC